MVAGVVVGGVAGAAIGSAVGQNAITITIGYASYGYNHGNRARSSVPCWCKPRWGGWLGQLLSQPLM